MNGKTHLAVGVAASLCVIRPLTIGNLAICTGAAVVGSVISDIDVKTSDSRDAVNRILGVVVILAIIEAYINYKYKLNVLELFLQKSNMYRIITGIAVLLVACIVCKELPHRSFMHSAIGVLTFSLIIYYIVPDMMMPFAIAMVSHIILDMFNKKAVRIWYPAKSGVALDWCKSDGFISNVLFIVGVLSSGAYMYFFFKS